MKKITLLTISLIKGGAEHQLVKLAIHLKKAGNIVTIVAVLPEHDFEEVLEENKIQYELIPIKKGIGFFKLNTFFKKSKPDLLISFMFGANTLARLIKLFNNIPLITSVRNNEIDKKFYYLYKIMHRIDTLSTFNSSYSLSKFTLNRLTVVEKSFLINNSIIINEKIQRTKINEEVFTLVSMAHFRPQKDYKTLFKAINLLVKKGVNVKLIVLGHLYGLDWPNEYIKSNQLNKNIEIVGFVKDTSKYLKQSDAVVLSSLWEGTPNAILEGMANKLPVISSQVPGCKELIELSESGFLFEKGNPYDLVKKIELLLSLSVKEKNEMVDKGYKYVLDNYSPNVVYQKWEELICKAIKRR